MTNILEGTPPETWANTILFRLAKALGYEVVDGVITVDPDQILDEAEEAIWRYEELSR